MVIVVNCLMLAMQEPKAIQSNTEKTLERIFLGILTLEMALKVVAMGFVASKHTYL